MGANRGTRPPPPPTFFQVGDGISNVPPPTFCGYDENWNFIMHFFFFCQIFLDARRERYPYKLFDADGAPPKKKYFQVGDGISNVPPTFCGYDENWNFFMHFFACQIFLDARRERYPYKLFDADGAPPQKVSEFTSTIYMTYTHTLTISLNTV